ncbi:MAG: hypothetical protein A2177_02805 [Spirochaetes bacterium RBG_13_68_11]|nr:MAG: hypothetical protein A2177_02805 [Spirochaetes bacterium RBG_13_68_11]
MMDSLAQHLVALYGRLRGRAASRELGRLIRELRPRLPLPSPRRLNERDVLLIVYPDMVREPGSPPLRALAGFCVRRLAGAFSTIHVLPFFSSSSDDGFSVIDYREVDPVLGGWEDVARLRMKFRLMIDVVANHVSTESRWFREFLRDDPRYRTYFIVVPEGSDVSRVVRPRSLPLLTRFETPSGGKLVWTTFSRDQVDLNYADPAVLLEMVDTLLFYVSKGAEFIRLDAVAYLWKELGTRCIHLPQTHRVVQLLRSVLEVVAPQVSLVTETNVPHEENISYFGNGMNESHLVYNFALPLLILHAFHAGNAGKLSQWATTLAAPSPHTTFLNFLASHDGIGINAGRGILDESEINSLVERVLAHGGLVSYKDNPDGPASPYELNINYFDALSNPAGSESDTVRTARFTTAHAIMLALAGVPAVYFHSIVGSSGWREGADRSGSNRAINRERLELRTLEAQLDDPDSRRARVYHQLMRLLDIRAGHRCFHPGAAQRILLLDPSVFAVLRTSSDDAQKSVLCVHNVSGEPRTMQWNARELFPGNTFEVIDLLAPHLTTASAGKPLRLEPYQSLWLKPDNSHPQSDRGQAVSSPGDGR